MGFIAAGMRGRVDARALNSEARAEREIEIFCKARNLAKIDKVIKDRVAEAYRDSFGSPISRVVVSIDRHRMRFITPAVKISRASHSALFTVLRRSEPRVSSVAIDCSSDDGCTCNKIIVTFDPPLTRASTP